MARFQIKIEALDLASPVIGKVSKMLTDLNNAKARIPTTGGFTGGLTGLASSFTAFNSAMTVATTAMGAVNAAIAPINNALKQADDLSNSVFRSAQTITALTGQKLGDSLKLANNVIVDLSDRAATLPGDTQDYLKLFNLISGSLVDATRNGENFNVAEFKQYSGELSQNLFLLGKNIGLTSEQISLSATRALSGQGSFKRLALFMRSPVLVRAMEKELSKMGKSMDDWTILSAKERLEVFNNATKSLVSPELVAQLSDSISGQIEGMKSIFTNPTTGLLSLFRTSEIQSGLIKVRKSALDSYKGLLKQLNSTLMLSLTGIGIVKDGTASDIVNKTMVGIFDGLAAALGRVTFFVQSYGFDGDLIGQKLGEMIGSLPGIIGEAVAGWFGIIKGVDFSDVSKFLVNSIFGFLRGLGSGVVNSAKMLVTSVAPKIASSLFNSMFEAAKGLMVGIVSSAAKNNPISRLFGFGRKAGKDENFSKSGSVQMVNPDVIPNKAAGNISGLSDSARKVLTDAPMMAGIAKAVAAENKVMPAGSKVVVANSSEIIIPRRIANRADGQNFESKDRNSRIALMAMAKNIIPTNSITRQSSLLSDTYSQLSGIASSVIQNQSLQEIPTGENVTAKPETQEKKSGGFFGKIFGGIKKVVGKVTGAVSSVVKPVTDFISPIANFISPIAKFAAPIASFIPGVGTAIAPILSGIGQITSKGGGGVLGGLLGMASDKLKLPSFITSNMPKILGSVGLNNPMADYSYQKPDALKLLQSVVSDSPYLEPFLGGGYVKRNQEGNTQPQSLLGNVPIVKQLSELLTGDNVKDVSDFVSFVRVGAKMGGIRGFLKRVMSPDNVAVNNPMSVARTYNNSNNGDYRRYTNNTTNQTNYNVRMNQDIDYDKLVRQITSGLKQYGGESNLGGLF
jgi:hypothetical protein